MISTETTLSPPAVAVFGATGHTGRFVVAELLRRGLTPIAIARGEEARIRAAFPQPSVLCRSATVDDQASLAQALDGAAAVINCAGPFLDTADAVARAAVASGVHYVDVSAEQSSTRATIENFDAVARQAGVVVIPAMGFYGGFADLLATVAVGDWDNANSIDVMIGLDSWHPTLGTRITGARNTAPRVVITGGQMAPLAVPPSRRHWDFGAPLGRQATVEIPFSEVVLIARHVRTLELHTFLSDIALDDIHNPATPAPQAADPSGRSSQRFVVEVVARREGEQRRAVARGRDIYAFSAPLVCEVVERVIRAVPGNGGAHAPGAIIDAHAILAALQPDHLTFEITAA